MKVFSHCFSDTTHGFQNTEVRRDDFNTIASKPLLGEERKSEWITTKGKSESDANNYSSYMLFVVVGCVSGFLIQMISLGAYAFMLLQHADETEKEQDFVLSLVLSGLTQIDIAIYVLIWMAFTCSMTSGGMHCIRTSCGRPIKRRFVFVNGVYFLVGIVSGSMIAWTMIDMYLDFPIPFVPIIVTVLLDLVLCYLMICCYDIGQDETPKDDGDGDVNDEEDM